jgi:hypothetical protein
MSDPTPIFTALNNATSAAHKNGHYQGMNAMKLQILELLKDRKRVDAALLKKIEEMKCH